MSKTRILTGITTTGTPHLGNYVGAIRPAIAASLNPNVESFYFLADYHALVKCDDPARIQQSTLEIAASWLACGLDPEKVYFYRQSDIPEIPELTWLLTCVTAKGLLNRAHAYKAATDSNREKNEDPDAGINAGLYMYPVLMAADILIFNANKVPVGRDQIQHIEMARDIAQRFNHLYEGEYFALPEAAIEENVATLPGLDGRKMSKSYDNTIPLFAGGEKALRTAIMSMVTDSSRPQSLEEARGSALYQLIEAFANPMHAKVAQVFHESDTSPKGWGTLKKHALESINNEIGGFRETYERLISAPDKIEDFLQHGAKRARELAQRHLQQLRDAVGLRDLRRPIRKSEKNIEQIDKSVLQPVVFRDDDKTFAFKVLDSKRNELAKQSGFADPKAAMAAAQLAMTRLSQDR
jgi:tryptophanyl-tRNA synthetase